MSRQSKIIKPRTSFRDAAGTPLPTIEVGEVNYSDGEGNPRLDADDNY